MKALKVFASMVAGIFIFAGVLMGVALVIYLVDTYVPWSMYIASGLAVLFFSGLIASVIYEHWFNS